MGKIAWINLSSGEIASEETPQEYFAKYGGSRGMAARILYDRVGPEIQPFDPANLLIFSVGPFTGTPWPCGARYTVTAKSPATGAYGYANSSGFFGPELKKAGYDALVIEGRAREPVYLEVTNATIRIRPAVDLWGKTTAEAEQILRDRHPKSRVATIGPAGENLVYFAGIINDYARAAARTGMGAVMGSKNLKAVVVKGSGKEVLIPPEFKELAREITAIVRDHPGSKTYRQWGTVALIASKNKIGDMPAKNHRWGQFPGVKGIDAEAVARYTVKNRGCFACPIKCSRITSVPDGPFKTPENEGPEYETTNALGSNLWNDNIELVIYANKLCNELGLDTISTGLVISFAMEAREKGLLKDPNYSLEWGDPESILGLIRDIAYQRGTGKLLARGVKHASLLLGGDSRRFALHVKGVEIPRQEGRVLKAFGLGHATSNRGADHLYALPVIDVAGMTAIAKQWLPDCGPELMTVTSERFKARMVRFTETCNALADALGICKFSFTETYAISPYDIARGLRALGIKVADDEILSIGQRIVNLERMYNVRHGLSRKDDQLPARFLEEPLDVYANPEEIEKVAPDQAELLYRGLTVDLDYMLDEYYAAGGWNENGIPTAERLRELGLEVGKNVNS